MKVTSYTSMAEAIEDLRKRGFTANFEFLNQSFRDSGHVFQSDDLTIVEHHRFEGISDPEDMSVVYAIISKDKTRGLIADAFGTYANPELGGFLANVRLLEEV